MVLYYMMPTKVLEFDAEKRKTRFIKECNSCGGYQEIIGATPALIKQQTEVADQFYRSDLAFSDGKSKHPLIFVGNYLKEQLEKENFRGLVFSPIGSEAIIR